MGTFGQIVLGTLLFGLFFAVVYRVFTDWWYGDEERE